MIGLIFLPLVLGWNYLNHGEDWTGTCSTGRIQSPINVNRSSPSVIRSTNSGFILKPTFQDVNSSLSLTYGAYRFINFFGHIEYQLFNIPLITGIIHNVHFHSFSENFLDGTQHDLEMHIVMTDTSGYYSHIVLGVWFKIGTTEDKFIKQAISANNKTVVLNLKDTFSGSQINEFIMFRGSLTTPPCTENALWFLDPKVRTISQEQYDFFNNMWQGNYSFAKGEGNYRELQDLDGRNITYYINVSAAGWIIAGLLALISA